jgi:hypothetical protein
MDETTPAPAGTIETPPPPETPAAGAGAPEPGPRRRKTVWVVLAALAALGLVAAIGVYGYETTNARREAESRLDEAAQIIEKADETVLAVDEIVREEITTDLGLRASELTPTIEPTLAELQDAIDLISQAKDGLPEERLREADAWSEVALSRIGMLEIAPPILEANVAAAAALDPAEAGWVFLLEGEKLADNAVVEYNKLNKDGVTKSKKLNTDAQAKFKNSRARFLLAAQAYATPDFDSYVTYLDAKIALLALSIKADDAFLKGNNAEANKISNQYNAKEKEAIALAKKLPETPARLIADAYEKDAGKATEDYFEARDAATEADAALADLEL